MSLYSGDVAALVKSHMNGSQLFERTIEQTTETMSPSHKTITAAAMTTKRITSLRELLHYCFILNFVAKEDRERSKIEKTKSFALSSLG